MKEIAEIIIKCKESGFDEYETAKQIHSFIYKLHEDSLTTLPTAFILHELKLRAEEAYPEIIKARKELRKNLDKLTKAIEKL